MYAQKATIHYRNGSTQDVILTQWSVHKFGEWARKRGWSIDPTKPDYSIVTQVRYQAYLELYRDGSPSPPWDEWDRSVNEVEVDEEAATRPVDPTQTEPSGG